MCRTHSQNFRALEELKKIFHHLKNNNSEISINGISIKGRQEMCLNRTLLQLKLNPKDSIAVCRDLRKNKNCKYFEKLQKNIARTGEVASVAKNLLNQPSNADEIINFCSSEGYCPYFLSKYLLQEVKVIICSYQWIYNPDIKEIFVGLLDTQLSNCILINDECHNIIHMATEVNSDRITPFLLKFALKDLETFNAEPNMIRFIRILISHLNGKLESLQVQERAIKPEIVLRSLLKQIGLKDLNSFKTLLEEMHVVGSLVSEEKATRGMTERDYIGSVVYFWKKWLEVLNNERYFFCHSIKTTRDGKRNVSMEIVALDPRDVSIPIFKEAFCSLSLSGTANPYVYTNLMGFNETGKESKVMLGKSPFPKENILGLIVDSINTKRENRTKETYKKMVSKIGEVICSTPGNTGVFCASYKVLKGLMSQNLEDIVEKHNKKLYIENSRMSATENALMVQDFKEESKNGGAVLLGVCGGRNSEGEDYPGDHMNSVIIAGFPYHTPTPRTQAKIEYYDKVFYNKGWDLAYLYPAIERANQASGRPIRKINDKGSIIFLDDRFKSKSNWIPTWLRDQLKLVPDAKGVITKKLKSFWNS